MSYFTKYRWVVLAFTVLVLLNLCILAVFWLFMSDNRKMPPPPAGNDAIAFLVRELKLDSQQQHEMELLRDEHRAQVRDIRKSNREAKDAFFSLLKDSTITDADIAAAASVSAQYDRELDLFTFKHFQKIRKLCTPAQQKRFDELIGEVLKMTAPPGQGGRPNGPPPRKAGEGHEPPPHPNGPPPQ